MISVRTVRSAPVYTPPKPKETEPHAPVAKQGAPTPEASAKKPEPKQKPGHGTDSSFDRTTASTLFTDPNLIPKMYENEPKTKEEALRRADEVLNPRGFTQRGDDWVVQHDGEDPTSIDNTESHVAASHVKDNLKLEREELKKLSESDRKKYLEVRRSINEDPQRSTGLLALQKMLFQGKLPGGKDFKGEGTTLDHLADAASGKNLAEGVSRSEFTNTLVRELATPSSINQGGRGTCAPTALMIDVAENNPAEYARISTGLASKEGKVELADGKTTLVREKETSFQDDGTGRSLNQRIIIPALMEIANGNKDYTDDTGEGAGASARTLDRLNDAIHGKNMGYVDIKDSKQQKAAMDVIDAELKSGNNVLVGMIFAEPGEEHARHKVLVTGTSAVDQKEGMKEYIHFINPWGTEERMLREEFMARLRNMNEGTSPDESTGQDRLELLSMRTASTKQTPPSLASLF
ncbi:hypothetical protein [Cystobacter ferrugineus]|uniref:Uncharacterized protein n=1 Tax=Cystobacter ferrugineus TaxID=83449 RepID=A0A1L9BFN6_9BACT|nr:hypothetical protein [Cystobacter ferrugineus]OJH41070.1 hypothetical protein BON30_09190 [Cystobacter ferrugineus]